MKTVARVLLIAGAMLGLGLAQAQAQAGSTRIEIGYIPILASTPLFVMAAEGWAKDEGLDLNLTKFEAGTAAIQALAAGKIDAIYAGIGPVLVARGAGVGVSVVANSAVEELALVPRGELAGFARKQASRDAIIAFADAKGRKVRIATQPPGSVPDTVLRHWLTKVAAIPADKVELVSMGIEKTQQALLANAIDAAMIREPSITILRDHDPDAAVLALGGEMFPDQPGTVVAFRDAFIKANRDAVARLVRLQVKAVALIQADSQRAAKDAYEFIGKGLLELSTLERAMVSPSSKFVADPHAIVEATRKMQAFQGELGIAGSAVPAEQGFDFSFYDGAR